ncbi:hypothetical protein DUNSADRAFT_10983 [Dunaliella salina]|uniref:Uncharacterized protein n=1 Tax=Dunaliella salina TaxID=3046 RepID=A0ABQ7GED1_DUNSA|nr:hypothetical protein DUNSADRAFT_10983 [Dunaliella salina]|eukprot:KAF5832966.1 hypothetical protein DUNSADRAFT_10983 [Dunaliella salina]
MHLPSNIILLLQALLATSLFLAAPSVAQIPRKVLVLDQDTFEESTQASTGQTRGIWFVLFNDKTHPRAGEANSLWMQLAMDEEKDFIVGEVFLNEKKCRALAWQFSEIQPPSAVLFRDQVMYIYPRPLHEPGALQKVQDFAAGGYAETKPDYVAGSVYGRQSAQEAQEQWVQEQKEKNRFSWKGAIFGICAMFVGFRLKMWAKKQKEEELKAKAQEVAEQEKTPKIEGGEKTQGKSGGKKTK